MENTQKTVKFFMGANSPDGFHSYFDEVKQPVAGFRSFLIKGGAGTGKSSLINSICKNCSGDEPFIEKIHCASDPNSLDGVIMYNKKISMFDATHPHAIEPSYPGGYQTIVNLCEYFDEEKLFYRLGDIVELSSLCSSLHKKCCNLLKCANILLTENYNYIFSKTDFKKICSLANRIAKKEFKQKPNLSHFIEHKRLLSAVTSKGIHTYHETANKLASKIYLIKDEYGASSNLLLTDLRKKALEKGYEIYSCYCSLRPNDKLEHLFIPSLNLGFVTSTKANNFEKIQPYSVISHARFTDASALKSRKQYLNFNKRAANEMINAAVDALKNAKATHDKLETLYYDAVDFKSVTKKTNELIEKINKRGVIRL